MPIEICCEQVAGFDAAIGTYQKCGYKFRVPDKYQGKSIKCPKCQQVIVVPELEPATAGNQGKAAQAELSRQPGVMDLDFDSGKRVSSAALGNKAQRCPKCGGLYSKDGVCTLCNYVEPMRKAQRDLEEKQIVKPAGFQLWLMRLSNEPSTAGLVGYSFFGAMNLFALLAMIGGILSASVLGVLLAVAAAFFAVLLWTMFVKTRQLAADPKASLGIFSPIWNLVLLAARQMKWEHYDSQLQQRKIIDLRHQEVNDETWFMVDGFKQAQVVDLQGCDIGDNGIRHLYGHHHLQCLVIKNTRVTAEAAANLQQSLPRLWIWR